MRNSSTSLINLFFFKLFISLKLNLLTIMHFIIFKFRFENMEVSWLKKIIFISLMAIFICALLVIPQSFAMDNETVCDDNNCTEYYFDVNVESDGNGSQSSPYNNFTDERIIDNSTIHLASGEYAFTKNRSFSNISFHGVSADNTILNGNGNNLNIEGIVNFSNVTLTNFRIINSHTLNAANVHFTNLFPNPVDEFDNNFGGAIYAASNRNIYLDNCLFFNNAAEYGGAIYVSGGNLTILNSLFYNNTAYGFAGAILGDSRVRIIINNTKFVADSSADDAGGAIYLISSTLVASNLEIANCSATFGPAITALNSDLNLSDVTFRDNVAKYDGGAIYQYYGSLILDSSRFIANTAENGAGLFINDVDVVNFTSNEFVNNTAFNYAGAIYSILGKNLNLSTTIFSNNSAYLFNDTYISSSINITLANGNYTQYVLNQTFNSTIPTHYDLRDYGLVTPVKNQEEGGNCWAFSAIATLESCILKASGEILDLSEENMKNLMAVFSDYGRKNRYPNDGGDSDLSIGYLVSWLGPVSEDEDSYDDKSQLSPVLNSLMHVQNVLFIKRDNYTDNDGIKRAIMNYGAVATSMYYDVPYWDGVKVSHYYNKNKNTPINHAVTIVGWDDSITVPNAPAPGAWIVRNSWGDDWFSRFNTGGYFYVSYYDYVFARPGIYSSFTFILNDTLHFDKNYQYDVSGVTDYLFVPQNTVWYENAFNATDDEFLAGVSTYFNKDTNWELFIYVNSKLQLHQNGFSAPGYYTINLNYPVPLIEGDVFEILFRITTDGEAGFPISERNSIVKSPFGFNMSFVSLNGQKYYDLYDLVHTISLSGPSNEHSLDLTHTFPNHYYIGQVACIKGFTQLITLNSTSKPLNIIYDVLDSFNITLNLLDENNNSIRNGNVTFNVNGENCTVSVYDGIAFLQVPFVIGVNNISWSFSSPNYYPISGNETYELLPIKLDMSINVLQDFNNSYVNFTFSQPINENLTVCVNGDNRTVEVINGVAYLNLTSLEYGKYNISAILDSEFYDSHNSTSFFVDVRRTCIEAYDFTTVYNSAALYAVRLLDQFNMPVVGREVKFIVGGCICYNVTDENGIAAAAIALTDSIYAAEMVFEGDGLYVGSQNSSTIIVNTTICLPAVTKYAFNSNYVVYLLDRQANALNNSSVTIAINNNNYTVKTDGNGNAAFVIPFNSGNFNVNVFNPDTGEVSSQNITVVKRITQNKNMVVYYGSSSSFKVRVCDDNGRFVAGLKVKFTINKKSYTVQTDKNGYASLKISLASGKYTIVCQYKKFKVSNSITIKPTLITKDFKVKKGKTIKFTAKLLDKNGKVLKGKIITFKIKGKTYKAKTNSKGVATIKIKGLNVGTYKMVTTYAKLKSTSKIVIKK